MSAGSRHTLGGLLWTDEAIIESARDSVCQRSSVAIVHIKRDASRDSGGLREAVQGLGAHSVRCTLRQKRSLVSAGARIWE